MDHIDAYDQFTVVVAIEEFDKINVFKSSEKLERKKVSTDVKLLTNISMCSINFSCLFLSSPYRRNWLILRI